MVHLGTCFSLVCARASVCFANRFSLLFSCLEGPLQDFLGFSAKIFATKICLVSASLVKCEDLSDSLQIFLLPNPVLSS
jgi:hypothetical protein